MGDLTRFRKPYFLLFLMGYLCIRTSHVIIYLSSLLIQKAGYCTLTHYRLVLCSNFSLLRCELYMLDQQFCECYCSISWVQFPQLSIDIIWLLYSKGNGHATYGVMTQHGEKCTPNNQCKCTMQNEKQDCYCVKCNIFPSNVSAIIPV